MVGYKFHAAHKKYRLGIHTQDKNTPNQNRTRAKFSVHTKG
jgi:hypothetical protein